jgi:hypothetical protein
MGIRDVRLGSAFLGNALISVQAAATGKPQPADEVIE